MMAYTVRTIDRFLRFDTSVDSITVTLLPFSKTPNAPYEMHRIDKPGANTNTVTIQTDPTITPRDFLLPDGTTSIVLDDTIFWALIKIPETGQSPALITYGGVGGAGGGGGIGGSGVHDYFPVFKDAVTLTDSQMYQEDNGASGYIVHVGSASAQTALEAENTGTGQAAFGLRLSPPTPGVAQAYDIYIDPNSNFLKIYDGMATNPATSQPGVDRLILDTSGNIAIGPDPPSYPLDLQTGSAIHIALAGYAGPTANVLYNNTGSQLYWNGNAIAIVSNSASIDHLPKFDDSTVQLLVDSNIYQDPSTGFLGMGPNFSATSPPANLVDIGFVAGTQPDGSDSIGGLHIQTGIYPPGNTTDTLYNLNGTLTWKGTPITAGGTVSGTLNHLAKFTPDGVSLGDSSVFEDPSGPFVGIGLTSPKATLQLSDTMALLDPGNQGFASFANNLYWDAAAATPTWKLLIAGPASSVVHSDAGHIVFYTVASGAAGDAIALANDTRMIIANNGTVGIGTLISPLPLTLLDLESPSSPAGVMQQLHVGQGTSNGGWLGSSNNTCNLNLSSGSHVDGTHGGEFVADDITAAVLTLDSGNLLVMTDSGLTVQTYYQPTLRMIVTKTGNVGIGVSAPVNLLDIAPGGIHIAPNATAPANTTDTLYNDPNGNLTWQGKTIVTGGVQTPWQSDIDAAGFDLNNLGGIGMGSPQAAQMNTAITIYGAMFNDAIVQSNPSSTGWSGLLLKNDQGHTCSFRVYGSGGSNAAMFEASAALPIVFNMNNVETMRIATSGYVGIGGVVNPAAMLDLAFDSVNNAGGIHITSGTPAATGDVLYQVANVLYWNGKPIAGSTISGTTDYVPLFTGPSTLGNSVIFQSGSSIGIGTTTPAAVLDVGTGGGIHLTSGVPAATTEVLYNNSGVLMWNGLTLATGATVSGTVNYVPLFTSASVLGDSVIAQYGTNIGIGTATAQVPLHVYSATENITADFESKLATGFATVASLNDLSNQIQVGILGSLAAASGIIQSGESYIETTAPNLNIITSTAGSAIKFAAGGNVERIRIDAKGNLGIGVTAPANLLDIAGGGIHITSGIPTSTAYALYNNAGTLTWNGVPLSTGASAISGTVNYIPVFTDVNSLGDSVIYQTSTGQVIANAYMGIGVATPVNQLDVAGNGIHITSGVPTATSYALYNNAGTLMWNGLALSTGGGVISGSAQYIPVFTSANTLGDSMLTQPGAYIQLNGASLDTAAGASVTNLTIYNSVPNASYLQFTVNRFATGTSWSTANTRIQQQIDATLMGYIDFNPSNAQMGIAFGSGTKQCMILDSVGDVGIGPAGITANAILSVSSTAYGVLRLQGYYGSTTVNNTQIRFYGSAVSTDLWAIGTDIYAGNGSEDFHFYNFNGTTNITMTLQRGGNVGIGTVSPQNLFAVASTQTALRGAGFAAIRVQRGGASNGGSICFSGAVAADPTIGVYPNSDDLAFGFDDGTKFTERMRIASGGNIGIGSGAAPNALLTIGPIALGTCASPLCSLMGPGLAGTAGAQNELLSIGDNTGNQEYLGIHSRRVTAGSGWGTTALSLSMDVDNTIEAGAAIWLYADKHVRITGPLASLDGIPTVLQYGCVGDGATNDTVAFQNAINAVTGTLKPGVPGILRIPGGCTCLVGTLSIPSHLHLIGDGDSSVIKSVGAALAGKGLLDIVAGAVDIVFESFFIEGGKVTPSQILYRDAVPAGPQGAMFTQNSTFWIHGPASDITFRYLTVNHTDGYLCYGDHSTGVISRVMFDNCHFTHTRSSVMGVTGDVTYGSWGGGILFFGDGATYNCVDITVQDCLWQSCTGTCFWTHVAPSTTLFNRNLSFIRNRGVDLGLDFTQVAMVDGYVETGNRVQRLGYVVTDDAGSTRRPSWLNAVESTTSATYNIVPVAFDTSAEATNAVRSDNEIECANGEGFDFDGLSDYTASGNVVVSAWASTDPVATPSQCGPGRNGVNWSRGINTSNSNPIVNAGQYGVIEGNKFYGCDGGSLSLYAFRSGKVEGNLIYQDVTSQQCPIVLGNIGPNYYQHSYDNDVTNNAIHWAPPSNSPAIQEQSQGNAFLSTDINRVCLNSCIGNNNLYQFQKDNASSSTSGPGRWTSVTTQAQGLVEAIMQVEGRGATVSDFSFKAYQNTPAHPPTSNVLWSATSTVFFAPGLGIINGAYTIVDSNCNAYLHSVSVDVAGNVSGASESLVIDYQRNIYGASYSIGAYGASSVVCDGNRNLINIGTINSGSITCTGLSSSGSISATAPVSAALPTGGMIYVGPGGINSQGSIVLAATAGIQCGSITVSPGGITCAGLTSTTGITVTGSDTIEAGKGGITNAGPLQFSGHFMPPIVYGNLPTAPNYTHWIEVYNSGGGFVGIIPIY
jgi:hypothetical protein